jgi:hypothetical protein
MLVATLAALAAAALFAVAAAVQHRSAGLVSDADVGRTVGLAGFVSKTLRHPLWIAGSLADIAGLGLHALALRDGPLALVQPLLVSGVVFALPLRQLLEHRRPRRQELAWAAALALGLVLFLTISTPTNAAQQPPDPIPTVISVALIGLGILACWLVGRRATGPTAAVVLGAGAGLAFAGAAGLLKESMDILDQGVGTLFTTWPLYALIVVGAIGLLLNQLAYQAGPLRYSLPTITTVDPVISLVVAVAVFDERFRGAPPYLLGEAVGLGLVVAAAVALTRSDPLGSPEPAAGAAPPRDDTDLASERPNALAPGKPVTSDLCWTASQATGGVAGMASEEVLWRLSTRMRVVSRHKSLEFDGRTLEIDGWP